MVSAVYMVFGATGGIGAALTQRLAKHAGVSIEFILADSAQASLLLQALLILYPLLHCHSLCSKLTCLRSPI